MNRSARRRRGKEGSDSTTELGLFLFRCDLMMALRLRALLFHLPFKTAFQSAAPLPLESAAA